MQNSPPKDPLKHFKNAESIDESINNERRKEDNRTGLRQVASSSFLRPENALQHRPLPTSHSASALPPYTAAPLRNMRINR